MTNVGFIGLGAMGSRLATRLLDAGYTVYATNRTRAKAEPLIARGLVWRDTARQVAAATDITFTMVTDDAALRAVTSGDEGLLAGLAPGAVYVDMSTVSPAASRAVASQVRALGSQMLDAPVSGSLPQAEAGTLAIMVGGSADAFAIAQPLLRHLGQTVTHVGASGQGLVLKLAINISLAAQPLAFAEGLLLAQRSGIDPELAAQVMSTSPIGSPMLRARVPLFLDPDQPAWFDMAMMHKDIRLAQAAGEEVGSPTPTTSLAERLLERARSLGFADHDIAAFGELLAHDAARPAAPEPVAA
jgi:3-hydroxyisobutyrate dehydrogenase-like beta-hydroxyacid dehydrogenase